VVDEERTRRNTQQLTVCTEFAKILIIIVSFLDTAQNE